MLLDFRLASELSVWGWVSQLSLLAIFIALLVLACVKLYPRRLQRPWPKYKAFWLGGAEKLIVTAGTGYVRTGSVNNRTVRINGQRMPVQEEGGLDENDTPVHNGDVIQVSGGTMVFIVHRDKLELTYVRGWFDVWTLYALYFCITAVLWIVASTYLARFIP